MKYIKQRSVSDCGVACLGMIAWHHGKKVPYTEIYEAVGADKSGSSIFGICEAAEKYQLEAVAMQGSAAEFIESVRDGSIKLPAMVRIVNQRQMAHFVVVVSVGKHKIKVYDPDMNIGKASFTHSFFENIFLGEVIEFRKKEDFVKEHRCKNPLLSFFKYTARHKIAIFTTLVLSFVVSGIGILSSFLLKYLVDGGIQGVDGHNHAHGSNEHGMLEVFAVMITGMFILYVVRFAVQLIRGKLTSGLAGKINSRMITDVYQKMVDLPIRFFGNKETGELMSRFSDAAKINEAISSVILSVVLDLVMFVGSGIMIYQLSPALFPYAVITVLVYAVISICYIKPIEYANRIAIGEDAAINSYIKETADGISTLKSCNAVETAKGKFAMMFDKFQRSAVRASMKNLRKDGLIELFGSVGMLLLLWVGAVSIANGDLTAGTMITVYSMLGYFLTPVQNIIEMQSSIQEAYIAAERLEDIYDSGTEEKSENAGGRVENGSIEFEKVNFAYPNSELILKDLSFNIENGSSIALVGASGCGKSTAAKLMTRLCNPESGSVRIGNHDVNDIPLNELRQNVVYVPQETFLFSDTIRNNLLLGVNDTVTDEEINEVLELCDCGFLKEKHMTLDSVVEENGTNFSGGQIKRLAFARALIRKPKVLILDETTANLDAESVRKITRQINSLPITKIWITHNPENIEKLDRVMSLEGSMAVCPKPDTCYVTAAAMS